MIHKLKTHTAPVFYKPGDPVPPTLSLLSAHTNLTNHIYIPQSLMIHETLPIYTGPIRTSRLSTRKDAASPYPKARSNVRFTPDVEPLSQSRPPLAEPHYEEEEANDNRSTSSDSTKIPKPDGEAGRPSRGGYTLEKELDWTPKRYADVRNYAHRLAGEKLDIAKSFAFQKDRLVDCVVNAAEVKFPFLKDYVGCWPVLDLLRLHLKYTSGSARKKVKGKSPARSTDDEDDDVDI